MDKIEKPACAECGGTNLAYECQVYWDNVAKRLEIGTIYDKGHYCSDCDEDVRIEWLPS